MSSGDSPGDKNQYSNSGAAETNGAHKDFLVVGIGASAGGIKPLREFFAAMPADSGIAFVVVLHLSPEHESQLDKILQTNTAMPVVQVRETLKVEPNRVYVIPPAKNLVMVDGVIKLAEPEAVRGRRVPIDLFFRTLADAYGKNGICVILSGTGADGAMGLKRVKEAGGVAIVQEPSEAEYDGMPRSAIKTQLVDLILPAAEIPEKLLAYKRGTELIQVPENDDEISPEFGAKDLREILNLIRVRTGHDFINYKQPTLLRRISRRLQVHGLESIQSYLETLREKPEEAQALLQNLLISVTNFFRDKEAFAALETEIIPRLFDGKTADDQVRVWCVGCATGEEAYSLAILLREYADALSDPPKIQIFASDIDEAAITAARESRYDETIAIDVSPKRLRRFFDKEGNLYRVRKEIREMILFAPHNILRDPPFSRQDLITYRNVLIYLNRQTQDRVLEIFHFALNNDGYLFLGASESAENVPALFTAVDNKNHTYKMRPVAAKFQGIPVMPNADRWRVKLADSANVPRPAPSSFSEIHYKLVERLSPPSLLVNENHDILHLSENAGRYLRFTGGEPTRNLGKVAHPALRSDLLAALFAAKQENKVIESRHLKLDLDGETQFVNLTVYPIETPEAARGFYLVVFDRIKPEAVSEEVLQKVLAGDTDSALEAVTRRLEEDLQRTKERLSLTLEQHKISVEELKASNEELMAMNEELRSATEELETSKEELQSVNEELTIVNQELKEKIDEVSSAHSDLQNLMISTDIDTIFLDRDLHIKRFTMPVRNIFNIIPTDIRRPIEHITHRLDYKTLSEDAMEVLRTLQPLEREVRSEDDRWFVARFVPYRTADDRIDGVLLTFLDFTERRKAETDISFQAQMLDSVEQSIIATDLKGIVVFWNRFAEKLYGWTAREAVGRSIMELTTPETTGEQAENIMSQLRRGESWSGEFEVRRRDGTTFPAQVWNSPITDDKGNLIGIVGASTDITDRKQIETDLQNADRRKDEFLATLAHELRNPLAPIRSGLEIVRRATSDKTVRLEALDVIERQTAQMVNLVDDLLDISRITQGKIKLKKTRFELKKAIDMAIETSRDMIETTKHNLILDLPAEPIFLDADFTRAAQIFLNILSNSIKYTAPGGEIRVTAEKYGGEAVISFFDNGIGIPAKMLPRIFDMFSQIETASEQAYGGLGIGLSVVKRLCEMHGGTISASSAGEGKGSEFVVRLPLAADQSAQIESELPSVAEIAQNALLKTPKSPESARIGSKRILVVDDNADAAQMLEVLLKISGHEVRTASDGETGLVINEEFQPEVALLDIGLPGISGYETASRIREKNQSIMLIAISGWGTENDRQRSSEAGFNYHLVKPVELEDLEKLLNEKRT